jgi:hypothetical protein
MSKLFPLILLLAAACTEQPKEVWETNQPLRQKIFLECLRTVPPGPRATQYNDWDEVVEACDNTAYYQAQYKVLKR